MGIVLELFSLLTFIIMVTRGIIFGGVGLAISSFLLGAFGYCTYALLASLVYLGFVLITGKKLAVSGKTVGLCALLFIFLVCLVHTITAQAAGVEYGSYGEYLSACYRAGAGGQEGSEYAFSTAGGVIFGLVVYPVVKLTTAIGGYIIFSLLTVGSVYLLYAVRRGLFRKGEKQRRQANAALDYATGDTSGAYDWNYAPTGSEPPYAAPQEPAQASPYQAPYQAAQPAPQPAPAEPDPVDRSKRLFSVGDEFDFKSRRELRQENRRAEEERRAAEQQPVPPQQPLSPYAQGHAILYGDRPASAYMNGFAPNANNSDSSASDWYNAHMGGGVSSSPRSSSRSSSSSAAPAGSSYTQNRIFDENSYFNRRGRSGISAEQYQNYFRSEPTPLSEGHERKSRTETPAPKYEEPAPAPKQETAAPSYTRQYQDEAESNITYSQRPQKIVTDTTATPSEPTAEAAPVKDEHDFYRNDVAPEADEGLVSSRPVSSFTGGGEASARPAQDSAPARPAQENTSASPAKPSVPRDQAVHIDVNDTARRAGFGSMETRHAASVRPVQETPPANSAEQPQAPARTAEPVRPISREGSGAEPRNSDPGENAFRRFGAEPSAQENSRGRFEPPREEMRGAPSVQEPRAEMNAAPASEPEIRTEPSRRVSVQDEQPSRRMPEQPAARTEDDARRAPEPRQELSRRAEPQEEPPEEETALRPISDELESAVNLFDDGDTEEPEQSSVPEALERTVRGQRGADEPARRGTPAPMPEVPAQEAPRPKHIYARYNAPSLDFLREFPVSTGAMRAEEVEQTKETIVETLAALKIPCEVEKITRGPSVTRYEINIPGNIPTSRVLGCSNELAMRLHAKDGINMQINYESGLISIEVPNEKKDTVGLKDLLLSPEITGAKPGSLVFGIGKDIEGRAVCGDVVKMTHLLVAGATNSGKSVCLHALIVSLLYKYSPEELRLILVDPKRNEFIVYDKMPHLMVNEIINDPAKVVTTLNWLITEMERRYSLFQEKYKKSGTFVRTIDDYNSSLTPEEERLPKIVVVIDELADLMAVAKKDVEDRIQRLTQKSRAAGIHLVLATQRPSVNVITGVIKSNLPTRIALKVTQEVDSRTILDESGAENLLGRGDLLYRTASMTYPKRVQGAFVTNEEIQTIVDYIKEHNEAYFDDSVADYINNEKSGGTGGGDSDDDSVEAVYIDALRYVVGIGQASISMIQRRCSVGYPKAGKIIEWMENMGYISAFDGAKARKVLLTQEEFESKYGDYGE